MEFQRRILVTPRVIPTPKQYQILRCQNCLFRVFKSSMMLMSLNTHFSHLFAMLVRRNILAVTTHTS